MGKKALGRKSPPDSPRGQKGRSRSHKATSQQEALRRLKNAFDREQRELRHPVMKVHGLAGSDPCAWLTEILYSQDLIPTPEDEVDPFVGVSAGSLHLFLCQLRTRHDQFLAAKLDHEKLAILAKTREERRTHEAAAERCYMVARTLAAIFTVSICDAHDLYGEHVSFVVTPEWDVRKVNKLSEDD
jgi:hypothetical protein